MLSSGSKGSGPSSAVGEMSSTSPAVRSLEKLDNYVRESHSSIRILCAHSTSGDGLLSHSELEAALGSLLTANEIKGLIEFLDAGHDGTIDLQEVETAVRSFRRKKAAGELDGWTGAGEAPLDEAQIFPNWIIKRREFQLIFERFAGATSREENAPAGGGAAGVFSEHELTEMALRTDRESRTTQDRARIAAWLAHACPKLRDAVLGDAGLLDLSRAVSLLEITPETLDAGDGAIDGLTELPSDATASRSVATLEVVREGEADGGAFRFVLRAPRRVTRRGRLSRPSGRATSCSSCRHRRGRLDPTASPSRPRRRRGRCCRSCPRRRRRRGSRRPGAPPARRAPRRDGRGAAWRRAARARSDAAAEGHAGSAVADAAAAARRGADRALARLDKWLRLALEHQGALSDVRQSGGGLSRATSSRARSGRAFGAEDVDHLFGMLDDGGDGTVDLQEMEQDVRAFPRRRAGEGGDAGVVGRAARRRARLRRRLLVVPMHAYGLIAEPQRAARRRRVLDFLERLRAHGRIPPRMHALAHSCRVVQLAKGQNVFAEGDVIVQPERRALAAFAPRRSPTSG